MIQPTFFNITTLIVMCFTVWVLYVRHRTKLDTNWPIFYYMSLILYLRKFEEVLDPNYVGLAVVLGLLLRFEFLGGLVLKTVIAMETLALGYVIVRCMQWVFGF